MQLCARKDVPVEQTWDLSLIYPEEKLMWEELEKTKADVKEFCAAYAGKLDTAEMIVKCLDAMEPINLAIDRFWSYAGLALEADYTDNALREREEKVKKIKEMEQCIEFDERMLQKAYKGLFFIKERRKRIAEIEEAKAELARLKAEIS